ncbi:hypothetical protein SCP_1702120 [Sparassis crispa]|uniref:Uncharacterized protein n=1 Tax=Sparassis crispa TaxID=139825 RepID=A0A401H616_9APHY|nr:hypothetical protein SCP_1702120 [Sparassis crispa]GBE89886.1 hypothetical protein SCP_1702120 [Sparassis crispa]
MSSFAPFDFGRYIWRSSPQDPSHWKREAGGGEYFEDVVHNGNHGEQYLFLGVKAVIATPVSSARLAALAREAWIALRFETPTIAAHTEHDNAGLPFITYRTAKDADEVGDWALRTVRLAEGTPDLDDLRFELGKKFIPEANGDQTFLYIVSLSDTSYDFLLHTSHVPFDGAGIKILLTVFFTKLAKYIDNPALAAQVQLNWGTEAKNLLPCVSEALGPKEDRSGENYIQTLGGIMSDLDSAMPHQYGFKARNFGPGPTRRMFYTFSQDESKRLLNAVKGRGFTLNHIAHAAISLVCALDNPPNTSTSPDARFAYYGLADSRTRLAALYSEKLGYPGYALGVSVIQIPVSAAVATAGESNEQVLLRLASIVKDEYTKQRAYPSLLGVVCQQVDLMILGLKALEGPPPPWMGPWYAGDGVGETYLQPAYSDAKGIDIIKINDFFVSLNKTDPGPFFRSYSWDGKLTLSVDANINAMPKGDVEGFMKKWVELLRLVL